MSASLPVHGQKLFHAVFGKGTVIEVKSGANYFEAVVIAFENYGEKELVWCFAQHKIKLLP